MDASKFSENDAKIFAILAAKVLMGANEAGNSMAEISLDPKQMFNLPGIHEIDAGKLMVVVAGGPSIQVLKIPWPWQELKSEESSVGVLDLIALFLSTEWMPSAGATFGSCSGTYPQFR